MTDTSDPAGGDGERPHDAAPRLAAAVADHFAGEGYAAVRPSDRAEGDFHLRPTGEAARFGAGEVVVDELPSADPTVVVDAVAAAAKRGRFALLAADPDTASEAHAVLTDPPGAASVDGDGLRTFYHVPDRLRVGSEGFGAVRADGDLVWRETHEAGGVTGEERTRIVLEADGKVQAAFDAYTDLACPAPTAFPYAYRRGSDKRIHVTRDGREVGVYNSIRELKADAYVPVPDPLVPEVHLPDGAELAGRWAIAAVTDGDVELHTE
jgi:hypothetical protein